MYHHQALQKATLLLFPGGHNQSFAKVHIPENDPIFLWQLIRFVLIIFFETLIYEISFYKRSHYSMPCSLQCYSVFVAVKWLFHCRDLCFLYKSKGCLSLDSIYPSSYNYKNVCDTFYIVIQYFMESMQNFSFEMMLFVLRKAATSI